MRKRVQIALVVLLVSIAGMAAWQVRRVREPVYEAKRLSVWLREIDSANILLTPESYEEENRRGRTKEAARKAVRQIGTNGIPTLLKMLGHRDSLAVSKLVGLWNRHIYSLPAWARYPDWYKNQAGVLNGEAVLGFEILGADAQQAVPALMRLYDEQNVSPNSQAATVRALNVTRALNAIGPAAQKMAIPAFLRGAASSNGPVRGVAVSALCGVDAEQQQVVPALVKALSDTNLFIRCAAAKGLGHFGTNAQQAVPTLAAMLSAPDARLRQAGTNALKQIDPQAAARAGVLSP